MIKIITKMKKLTKMKKIIITMILTLGVILSNTERVNAQCPTSVVISGSTIVFTYSGGVPSWELLKKIRYTSDGTTRTTSVATTSADTFTITVPLPTGGTPQVTSTSVISEIQLATYTDSTKSNAHWGNYCSINLTLPVDLVSFEGDRNGDVVNLSWTTAMELDNNYFAIERSYDAKVFTTVGYVEGAGNSSNLIDYNYSDSELEKAYYRLKQVDYNGEFEYSKLIVVRSSNRTVISVSYYTLTGVETSEEDRSLTITKYSDGSITKTMQMR